MNAEPSQVWYGKKAHAFLVSPKKLFIDGKWADALSKETFAIHDPSTGQSIGSAAAAGPADIALAVAAARRAVDDGRWARLPPSQRRKLMLALADAIDADTEVISELETLDNGMPLSLSGWLAG